METASGRATDGIGAIDWTNMPRRRFLRTAGALGALAAWGLGSSGCQRALHRAGDGGLLLTLSAQEATTFAAVAAAVVPTQEGFPDIETAQVVRRFDEELSFVSPVIRADLKAALDVFEWLPPLYGHFARFSVLDRDARRTLLTQLCASRIELLRAIATNLKILAQFFYFAHPAVWNAIGYDGPFGRMPEQQSEQRAWYARQTMRSPT
ncbi:hypothetical protein SAMN04488120_1184 [Fontimonas thermophila]|uniref:Gluconate 2-dehydrogenase subunit 3 n=1 Tax=Fontimonas thermophila TaxID=1076937 RepID=A0A1I2KKG8_9GAMM|nr:hypothetical protein [Fontimonas thermophila]SFF65446.1 hypothetical protein SAMN04488120_1184 [Fontimonas thermophila]